jgi:hypothetical protein
MEKHPAAVVPDAGVVLVDEHEFAARDGDAAGIEGESGKDG